MLVANYRPQKPRDPFIWIVISTVLASVLVVYPLAYDASAWRPCIMLLVMLFWVLCQPAWCGVWFAFGLGIFTDLLLDAPLGQNALIYVVITFAARYFIRERRVLTFLNLWIIAILAILTYVIFVWVTQVMAGINYPVMRRWPPLISSVFAWPMLYYCLKKWRA
ncbi:rod shape-determining protein MreD [Acinetobacter sp. ANC 4635]|uniref:rod shape-determining protein MreD n=1 Tax=Acinetobacter sp. ANC 4635 TaxID=2529846 RepID=UPI00103D0CF5|nr:rod shape-determining protein MreD [Acinetobacter sp. ANC 4635]TCB32858.1 rod shape-determining protein MreD [Acinetobacter sp. ANC 4635]